MCNLNFVYQTAFPDEETRKPKRPRVRRACLACQSRKVKCSGTVPCKLCSDRKFDCVFKASKMYPLEVAEPGKDPQMLVRKERRDLHVTDSPSPVVPMTNLSKYLDAKYLPRLFFFFTVDELKNELENSIAKECVIMAAAGLHERLEANKPCSGNCSEKSSAGKYADGSCRQSYFCQAKKLVVTQMSDPSVEVIVAVLLIAYAEICDGQLSGAWVWLGMADRLSQQISLDKLGSGTFGHKLYWSILCVERILSFELGKPGGIQTSAQSEGLIYHVHRLLSSLHPLATFLEDPARDSQTILDRFKAEIFAPLPYDLAFTHENLTRFAAAGNISLFLLLHLWRQALGLLTTYPSVAYERSSPLIPRTTVFSASNCNMDTLINFSTKFDPDCFVNPLLARPLGIAATTALNMQALANTDQEINILKSAYELYNTMLQRMRDAGWKGISSLLDKLAQIEQRQREFEFSPNDYWDMDPVFRTGRVSNINDDEIDDMPEILEPPQPNDADIALLTTPEVAATIAEPIVSAAISVPINSFNPPVLGVDLAVDEYFMHELTNGVGMIYPQ